MTPSAQDKPREIKNLIRQDENVTSYRRNAARANLAAAGGDDETSVEDPTRSGHLRPPQVHT